VILLETCNSGCLFNILKSWFKCWFSDRNPVYDALSLL